MFSITSFTRRRPPAARVEFAVQRSGNQPRRGRGGDRQRSQDDRLYFAVRSFGFNGARQILQYAFADDRGNVVLSSFGETTWAGSRASELAEEMLVKPFDAETQDYLTSRICDGAHLVAFGQGLQIGLLPCQTVKQIDSVECAWRRFVRLSRERNIAFDRHQSLTLSDALELAGLPPLTSQDAAMRALAVRDLWIWMDSVELGGDWS